MRHTKPGSLAEPTRVRRIAKITGISDDEPRAGRAGALPSAHTRARTATTPQHSIQSVSHFATPTPSGQQMVPISGCLQACRTDLKGNVRGRVGRSIGGRSIEGEARGGIEGTTSQHFSCCSPEDVPQKEKGAQGMREEVRTYAADSSRA